MPPTQRLLTLLHISDLHLGFIDPQTGDADYTNAFVTLFSNFSWFDGLLGHHARGLQDLVAFYQQIESENPLVLTTGDLTRVGHSKEFDNADDFLVSRLDLNPPNGNFVGLRYAKWRDYAIPGNHDYWPGTPTIVGGPTSALTTYFPSLPYVCTFRKNLSLGYQLEQPANEAPEFRRQATTAPTALDFDFETLAA